MLVLARAPSRFDTIESNCIELLEHLFYLGLACRNIVPRQLHLKQSMRINIENLFRQNQSDFYFLFLLRFKQFKVNRNLVLM